MQNQQLPPQQIHQISPDGFSYFSRQQRTELQFLIQQEAQNIVRQSLPMLFSNFQKMSLVKAARFFVFPDFATERLKALGEIDQNFDLNDGEKILERQKYDRQWEEQFSKFFFEKKLQLPVGFKSWVECMISINTDMEAYNVEVTKKKLIEDKLFNKYLNDVFAARGGGGGGASAAASSSTDSSPFANGAVRRDREEVVDQTAQQKLIAEVARKAMNDFYKKHCIADHLRQLLWNAMSKKRLTFKTGAPWDEAKVREVCAELNIPLKD